MIAPQRGHKNGSALVCGIRKIDSVANPNTAANTGQNGDDAFGRGQLVTEEPIMRGNFRG